MKTQLLAVSFLTGLATSSAMALNTVYDETSLQQAIALANTDTGIETIVFARDAHIRLSAPVVYSGSQPLRLQGNGALIDGTHAGSFQLDNDLTATTEDGTLVFNTAADISIRHLTVTNNATRGVVVNIPENATGDDITVSLHQVEISNSALYGLHIDDNVDAFDDGNAGSDIGVVLNITQSHFVGNGTGAIDFDGVRVDERGDGDIQAMIVNSHIDLNGGDGIELDEAGAGSVDATMVQVTINGNGFYNEEDLDDGFDIDEADNGDIAVKLVMVEASNNMDEGLDFDEAGDGNVELKLRRVNTVNNADEGIKVDEEDGGDIDATLANVAVRDSGDDGIQFTELGAGQINAKLNKVIADANAKYGIKLEQWMEEDEADIIEAAGSVHVRHVQLSNNGKGDQLKLNNIIVE